MYRAEEQKWKKLIREEKVGITRISILAAVLVLLMMVTESIRYDAGFSIPIFTCVFVALFGLFAGLSFAVCCIVRSFRGMPFIRTAVAALLCMAVPMILFTFGIVCMIMGIDVIHH